MTHLCDWLITANTFLPDNVNSLSENIYNHKGELMFVTFTVCKIELSAISWTLCGLNHN
jgi:hypothetical protein